MSFDLSRISDAQNRALVLIDSSDKRQVLDQFIQVCSPLVTEAVLCGLHELADEINTQLGSRARLRLVLEGNRLLPEIVPPSDEAGSSPIAEAGARPGPVSPRPPFNGQRLWVYGIVRRKDLS